MCLELRLCGVMVFADQAGHDGSSPDGPRVGKVGRVQGRQCLKVRRSLAPGLVRPDSAVTGQVLAEHQCPMPFTEDQDPVQAYTAEGSDDAFADGVHPRRLRQGRDDSRLFGFEHLPKRGSEERITIINQEPQRAKAITQVHDEIAGLLHRPRTGRLRGHSPQVQSSGAVLNDTSTYNRLSSTVSTTKKSQAITACAWAARNCRQPGPARRGAGSMPAVCRNSHTVEAAIAYPSRASSP